MPRVARRESETGCYHVVARGVGRQIIFENDVERRWFLDLLKQGTEETQVRVIAWCLMDNHAHLLLQGELKDVSVLMHKVLTGFAVRHNAEDDHVGHVFQNRFHSDPIVSESHLLATVRYIHCNPEKAGFSKASEYRWSSFSEYVSSPWICDTTMVLDLLGGREGFLKFSANADLGALGFEGVSHKHLSTAEVAEAIRVELGQQGMDDLTGDSRSRRDAAIEKIGALGFSARQIERVTGIGRTIVNNALSRGA